MIDLVMLCQNRPKLVHQALQSLVNNTKSEWRLTIVDDGSGVLTEALLKSWAKMEPTRIHVVRREMPLGPGRARNLGIERSEQDWGRGDWLYLCDSDMYAESDWDMKLLNAWPKATEFGFKVLGAYCHPYNQSNAVLKADGCEIHEKYAIGLLSWMMEWKTYDEFGPFEPAPIANFSEDFAFCHKVRLAGFRVGSIWPQPVINCGLTGSNGKLSPGSELLYKQAIPPGVVIE